MSDSGDPAQDADRLLRAEYDHYHDEPTVPDPTTARDDVLTALYQPFVDGADDFTDDVAETMADAVLAALGIPPDATTDDVRVAWIAWHLDLAIYNVRHGEWIAVGHEAVGLCRRVEASGPSPAAAILALAAALRVVVPEEGL